VTAVEREVDRQLVEFRKLTGRDPTHLDSHQHFHRQGPAARALEGVAYVLRVPLLHATPGVTYRGDFYGQTATGESVLHLITPAALARLIRGLGSGTFELACHPGAEADGTSAYDQEREAELEALCSSADREAVRAGGVRLCSFIDLARG